MVDFFHLFLCKHGEEVQERKGEKKYCMIMLQALMDITRYLFLEVADGVLVSVREEVEDFMLYVIFLQVVH